MYSSGISLCTIHTSLYHELARTRLVIAGVCVCGNQMFVNGQVCQRVPRARAMCEPLERRGHATHTHKYAAHTKLVSGPFARRNARVSTSTPFVMYRSMMCACLGLTLSVCVWWLDNVVFFCIYSLSSFPSPPHRLRRVCAKYRVHLCYVVTAGSHTRTDAEMYI